ncbi:Rv3654c family TadE-like protein [Nocardioides baekrokdamisoli]|nr:Rv3654c family TadE-like protein [Nocardioides baekrokdamisoli]
MLTDRGSATMFVAVALTVVLFAGLAVATVNGLVVVHRRAQSAADLAALAGAGALMTASDPCAAAGRIAAANGATVEDCQPTPDAVTVVVSVPGPEMVGGLVRLRAHARAGR